MNMEDCFLRQVMLFAIIAVCVVHSSAKDMTKEPGHMKPFGSGKHIDVEHIQGFPSPKFFFENYVEQLKPVLMKGAGKISPAFKIWTDDYFLSFNSSVYKKVTVNIKNKEDRKLPAMDMDFKKFVQSYNISENYMVNPVPGVLRKDVVIPCPLQCPELIQQSLVENVMWYNNGGTSSLVHTDAVDNMNCLYRGEKTFVMVDPAKNRDNVDLDVTGSHYSNLDPDSVDFVKYPGIAEIKGFYVASVSAGDCLYVPYNWIHQVRSYGNNLAVNIWWNHYHSSEINLDQCNEVCDTNIKLGDTEFRGFTGIMENPRAVRDYFEGLLGTNKSMDIDQLWKKCLENDLEFIEDTKRVDHVLYPLIEQMFGMLDVDGNKTVTLSDTEKIKDEGWMQLQKILDDFEYKLDKILDEQGPPLNFNSPDIEDGELQDNSIKTTSSNNKDEL